MTLLNIKLSNGTKRLVRYTPPTKGTVVIGGRTYPTVKIGNQWWLAENLDYKFSYNGSTLPIGGSGAPTTPAAWYYYNNEASYGIDGTYKCGLLYNWYAAKYLDDNKATLLPEGWHMPTSAERDVIISKVGGASIAGTELKALDNSITSNWPSNWNGTDSYGFNALPCGCFSPDFYELGTLAYFWTSSEYDSEYSYRLVISSTATVSIDYYKKFRGYSIRLVKDA